MWARRGSTSGSVRQCATLQMEALCTHSARRARREWVPGPAVKQDGAGMTPTRHDRSLRTFEPLRRPSVDHA